MKIKWVTVYNEIRGFTSTLSNTSCIIITEWTDATYKISFCDGMGRLIEEVGFAETIEQAKTVARKYLEKEKGTTKEIK